MMFWVSVFLGFWVGVCFFWCVFLCFGFLLLWGFFKRTSVIAPIYNSYVTKLGKGKCNATMVMVQLKDQGPSCMKTTSSLL